MRYRLERLIWNEYGEQIEACIEHEKRLKRCVANGHSHKLEKFNPDWRDISDRIA